MSRERIVLGWREWLSLPELGIVGIRAKIDTGARSSALHVENQECFERDGVEFVRFSVDLDGSGERTHQAEAKVSDRRMVTDSGGHRGERIFIRTRLCLDADRHWPVEINLTQRRNMLFPMLLGRTALRGRCLVEPARSFLLGASPGPGHTP